jgi:prepilin-type processing-associated H-X9-DG protein
VPNLLFRCPSDETFKWAGSTNLLSYGYNYIGCVGNFGSGLPGVRPTDIKEPFRTILAGDSIKREIMYGGLDNTSPSFDTYSVGDRHNGGANILWCDGHVDWHVKNEVDKTDAWWTRDAD